MKSTQILEEIYGRLSRHYGPQGWWPGESPLEVIVGAILVQNTAWRNVEKAISNLKRAGALSVDGLLELEPASLAGRIRPAGYFNRKAERLRAFLNFLKDNYGGELERMRGEPTPKLRAELLGVKGIGPETADAILLYALGHPVFVVDTYTYRIFTRHALAHEEIAYEELQEIAGAGSNELERNREFHALLVRVGQDFCRTKERCDECPLKGVNWRDTEPSGYAPP